MRRFWPKVDRIKKVVLIFQAFDFFWAFDFYSGLSYRSFSELCRGEMGFFLESRIEG
jgi:hypothetical protein